MTTPKDRPASAAIVLRRPARALTTSAMLEALEPLTDLLQLDLDEVLSLTITPKEVRVHLIPSQRGRRVDNARVRVSWPIAHDPAPRE
jgi:hypothetical protein